MQKTNLILILISFLTLLIPIRAEVVLDGTLGRSGALPGPDYLIGADLGQQHGGNLFHSFQDFNLDRYESATFSGPNSVQNLISRVTGGNPSQIFGTLRSTIPDADFYFLNPHGILFGEGASLDVQGSFHASTADTLRFSDGGEFNARYPNNSLLTVAPISAFGFLTDAPSAISIEDTKLSVSEGETLSLIGGDIRMDGQEPVLSYGITPQYKTEIDANSGRINLASIASEGEVIPTDFGLSFSKNTQRGQITLNKTLVKTKVIGHIFIRGGNIKINKSFVDNTAFNWKNSKLLDIRANNLTLTNGGRIISGTLGSGNGGEIVIKVADTLKISGQNSGINGNSTNTGNAANIDIEAGKITLTNGSQIASGTRYSGNGGKIIIKVADALTVIGQDSGVLSSSVNKKITNAGNAGNIDIKADKIILNDGGQIVSATKGSGDSGKIDIKVSDVLKISGQNSGIGADSRGEESNTGNAGNIDIKADKIILNDGGQIASFTKGSGDSGRIDIKVTNILEVYGHNSGIGASSLGRESNNGNAGDIDIKAAKIILIGGGQIVSVTNGSGNAGAIILEATDLKVSGKSENGELTSSILSFSRAQNTYAGNAGNILMQANIINLSEGGQIFTSANNAAGGDVIVKPSNLLYLRDGIIFTAVKDGKGDGGNITIEKPVFVVLDGGAIITKAKRGFGGDIKIDSQQFLASSDADNVLDASSDVIERSGTIVITAPEEDISGTLLILPATPLNTDDLQKKRCEGLTKKDLNKLIVIDRDVPPITPDNQKTHYIRRPNAPKPVKPPYSSVAPEQLF